MDVSSYPNDTTPLSNGLCDRDGEPLSPRRERQADRIIDGLLEGPMTNVELAEISLSYNSRICELRKAGYTILRTNEGGGLHTYTLAT